MREVRIVCTGNPVAKGRGRAGLTRDGRPVIFTPSNTRKWENDCRQLARIEMDGRPPLDGPLQIIVRAVFVVPTSWPSWKRDFALQGLIWHTGKPDGDNVLKAMKDALNGVVYLDDSQIAKSGIMKAYGPIPTVIATVRALDGYPSQITKRPAA